MEPVPAPPKASSWGKVNTTYEQMVFAEATSVLPLMISYIYHKGSWKKREFKNWTQRLHDVKV